MLPERHHLLIIGGVHFIKRTFNAVVGKSAYVRRIGESAPTLEHQIYETILNFNFGRNVKQSWHMVHKALLPMGRAQDVTLRKAVQSLFSIPSTLDSFS